MENKILSNRIDIFNDLPTEIWLKIFNCVKPEGLLNCSQVCKRWNQLCNDPLIWYVKCMEIKLPNLSEYQTVTPFAKNKSLKRRYWILRRLLANWQCGETISPVIVSVHENRVITDLTLLGKMAASCSDDGGVAVLDLSSGKRLHQFRGHRGGVWALTSLMIGGQQLLVTSGSDCVVRVWQVALDGCCECLHSLIGHEATVRCLAAVSDDLNGDHCIGQARIVSGSRDSTLRIWDVQAGRCVHLLAGHTGAVRCVRADAQFAVSGSYDYTVRVWHMQSGLCTRELVGHTSRVYTIFLGYRVIVSTSLDTTIRLWQRTSPVSDGRDSSRQCEHLVLSGHRSLPCTVAMDTEQTLVVSGGADGSVRVWRVSSGDCLFRCDVEGSERGGHLSGVTSVHVVLDRLIVSSSVDGALKLWSLECGRFIRDIWPAYNQSSSTDTATSISDANAASTDNASNNDIVVVWRSAVDWGHLVAAAGSSDSPNQSKLILFDFSVKT